MEHNEPKQIKSKERVTDFGEVFTHEREINAMLDLMDTNDRGHIISDINKTILEPSCGNGNFLLVALQRKLQRAQSPQTALQALASLYGVEIQKDNVEETCQRLLNALVQHLNPSSQAAPDILHKANDILQKNIIWGDFLAKTQQQDQQPIRFYEWQPDPDGYPTATKSYTLTSLCVETQHGLQGQQTFF